MLISKAVSARSMKIILDYISIIVTLHIHLLPQTEREKRERFPLSLLQKNHMHRWNETVINNNWDSNCSSVKYSQSEEMLAKWETSVTPSKTKHQVFKSLSSYCEITMRIILITIPEDMLSICDSSASSSTGNHCLETIHEMQFTM